VYDEIKHSGNIRHIIIRKGFNTNQYLVIIVTQEASLARGIYEELPKSFDGIVGVVQNRNPVKTNRILGDEYKKLIGQDYYFETVLNKRFRISAGSFFQVNTAQTETLVKQVIKLLAPTGQERVLDLFAGVGTFTIPLADFVDKVTGIEINRIAVLDANESLRINTINNVEFIAAPAEQGIKNFQQVDAVILDPPRKGCGKELIEGIAGLRPKKIIYISCNPTTLARDLAIFDHIGYEVSAIELVDLFPQTYHIEAVAKIVPKL
ncbi:MAG: 23S rRNA (uracil(1939)-C(5))-methyltransferase RlmD, partial [candidate division WOR-3 bacterium]